MVWHCGPALPGPLTHVGRPLRRRSAVERSGLAARGKLPERPLAYARGSAGRRDSPVGSRAEISKRDNDPVFPRFTHLMSERGTLRLSPAPTSTVKEEYKCICYPRQHPPRSLPALLLAALASASRRWEPQSTPSPIPGLCNTGVVGPCNGGAGSRSPNRRQRRSELGAVPSGANCAFKRPAHGSSGRGNVRSGFTAWVKPSSPKRLAGEWAQLRVDHSESRECCGRVLFLSDYVYDSQRVRPFHRRDFRHVYIR
jgi:hypothetical protein